MTTPRSTTFSGTDMPDLAELPMPSAVSLFPQTLAWKIVLVVIVIFIVTLMILAYRRYQRRLWRRQAQQLAVAAQHSARVDTWFTLIKRVTLLHLGRERLRKMDDVQLLQQLPLHDSTVVTTLLQCHYQRDAALSDEKNRKLAAAFHRWLKDLPDV